MTSLVAGQNLPWPDGRVTVYVERATLVALVLDAAYRARDPRDWVARESPAHAGVSWLAGPPEGVSVELDALAGSGAERVLVLASGTGARAHLLDGTGAVVADFAPDPADAYPVALVEVYRRAGSWRVRAVGRGVDGGLAGAARAHGLPPPATTPRVTEPTSPEPTVGAVSGPAGSGPAVSGPAAATPGAGPAGGSGGVGEDPDEARLLQLVAMILDDASRTTASRRSSVTYAEERLEREIESVVSDPRLRIGPEGDRARAAAAARRDELRDRADAAHARDLAQLAAELADLEIRFPAAMARWDSASWRTYDPAAATGLAFRAGELSVTEAPGFRVPLLLRLPLTRPLWIDPEQGGERAATQVMAVLALRMACALAPLGARVTILDVGGRRGTLGFPPQLLAGPVVTDAGAASQVLFELVERAELVRVAAQAGALDSLDPASVVPRIVICPDLPIGLDESGLSCLHRLAREDPSYGVHLLLSGSVTGALGIPALQAMLDASLLLPSADGGDLVDAFGGVEWVFVPDPGPSDDVAASVFSRFVASRRPGP